MINGTITAINRLLLFQIRGRFSADFAPRPRKSSPRHCEVGRLPRAVSGAKVRAVLQLQHRRYGDERHDAEQQGHQHQSLRYAALERIYTYICTVYTPTSATIPYVHDYSHTHTLMQRRTHTRTHAYIRTLRTHIQTSRLLCQRPCTYIRPGNKAFALTAINTPSPSALAPPLLYHPQRCTRTVQLTRRTIMRYRNSARCPCSIRMPVPAAGQPSPAPPAIRTASSPKARGPRRPRTRR